TTPFSLSNFLGEHRLGVKYWLFLGPKPARRKLPPRGPPFSFRERCGNSQLLDVDVAIRLNRILPLRFVMSQTSNNDIRFVDTTLRDGQESLWATAMRTRMILPIASPMDEAGFEAIEIIATTNFKKQIRDLKENPWERIRLVADKIR